MTGLYIFLIIFLILMIICLCTGLNTDDSCAAFVNGFLTCFWGMLAASIIMTLFKTYYPEPEPIDVYRGRTTLEITYKDSVPMDSVVVFK